MYCASQGTEKEGDEIPGLVIGVVALIGGDGKIEGSAGALTIVEADEEETEDAVCAMARVKT